jgi:hypothetical protein
LNLADVASELQTPVINIKRLIAKGRLQAMRIADGDSGLRFSPSVVAGYVADGCRDKNMPPAGSYWYGGDLSTTQIIGEQLAAAGIGDVSQDLIDSAYADWRSRNANAGLVPSLDISQTSLNDRQRMILAGPSPDARYATVGGQMVCAGIREAARLWLQKQTFISNGLATIFQTPESFSQITNAAITGFQKMAAYSYSRAAKTSDGTQIFISFLLKFPVIQQFVGLSDASLIALAF